MKYTKLTKDEFDKFNEDEIFKQINNKIHKLKARLEKRKKYLFNKIKDETDKTTIVY